MNDACNPFGTPRPILSAVSALTSEILNPHGIERPDETRVRHYFLDPATGRQVLVNVWPGGEMDVAFETEPGVFGVPQPVRRSESEVVG